MASSRTLDAAIYSVANHPEYSSSRIVSEDWDGGIEDDAEVRLRLW